MAETREGYVEVPSWVGGVIATVFLGLSGYALKTANDAYYTALANRADIQRIDATQQQGLKDIREVNAIVSTVAAHEKFNQITDERLQALRGDAQQLHDQIYRMLAANAMEAQRRPLYQGDATVPDGQPPAIPRDVAPAARGR